MKNLVVTSLLVLTTVSFAQERHQERAEHRKENMAFVKSLSPKQQASLKTKKMTLALNLTKEQQVNIYTINLKQAKDRKERFTNQLQDKNTTKSTLSPNEKYIRLNTRLDKQIAYKQQMSTILSEKQFEQWQKTQRKHLVKKRHSMKKER